MTIPKVVSSAEVYKGKLTTIEVDELTRGEGENFLREVAVVANSVAIVALDNQDRVLLVKQYRHALKHAIWEIPAGRMDVEGETPEQTALRELREETDTTANKLEKLIEFNNSVGWTTEKTSVFLATGLEGTTQFERSNEEADIEKEWIALSTAHQMVEEGTLTDAKTIIGILLTVEKNPEKR